MLDQWAKNENLIDMNWNEFILMAVLFIIIINQWLLYVTSSRSYTFSPPA